MHAPSQRFIIFFCCPIQDEGVGDGAEVPYNYDGSSCASEDGSSSDDGRLDSDDDMEYPRRVLECRLSP